jgi:hypothetical protein
MKIESRSPAVPNRSLQCLATAVVLAVGGSAFAQEKPREQIMIEMKIIEAQDGAMGLPLKKGSEPTRRMTPAQLQAETEKLSQTKGVDFLSAPKVITNAGQRAVVEIGNDADAAGAGIKINVLPEIVAEGIRLHVIFECKRAAGAAGKSKAKGSTKVLKQSQSVVVKDGDTVAIGGMDAENGRAVVVTLTPSKVDPGKANPAIQ